MQGRSTYVDQWVIGRFKKSPCYTVVLSGDPNMHIGTGSVASQSNRISQILTTLQLRRVEELPSLSSAHVSTTITAT